MYGCYVDKDMHTDIIDITNARSGDEAVTP